MKDIRRPRNEKHPLFRPFTAPPKEQILLNRHLLRTQDFKEILNEKMEVNQSQQLNDTHKESKLEKDSLLEESQNKKTAFRRYENKEFLNISKTTNEITKTIINPETPANGERIDGNFGYFMTGVDFKDAVLKKFPLRPQSSKVRFARKTLISPRKSKKGEK